MKKIIVFILSLLLITSCTSKKIEISEVNYKEVTYSEILEKIKNDETFVYYIGSDSCVNCKEYLKNLDMYFKNHSSNVIYYVNANDNFTSGQEFSDQYYYLANIAYHLYGKSFNTSDKEIYESNKLYTPTTFAIINGEYARCVIGAGNEIVLDNIYATEYNNIKFNDITYDEAMSLINGKDDYILYFGQDTCPNCLEFRLLATSFARQREEVIINYLNITPDIYLDNEKKTSLIMYKNNVLGLDYQNNMTLKAPSLFRQQNEHINGFEGVPTRDEFKEFIK